MDDERIRALEALNTELRRVIDLVRRCDAPMDALEAARAQLHRVGDDLDPHAWDGPIGQRGLRDAVAPFELADRDPMAFFPYSPLIGRRNPIAPPATFEMVEGAIIGRVTLSAAYCGPPNHVHGGVIAALFDELLGTVNVMNDLGAMTGRLIVHYRQPTPLGVPLRLEGRHTGSERRKVFAEGKLYCGDRLLAEAEGLFVRTEEGMIERLMGAAAEPSD